MRKTGQTRRAGLKSSALASRFKSPHRLCRKSCRLLNESHASSIGLPVSLSIAEVRNMAPEDATNFGIGDAREPGVKKVGPPDAEKTGGPVSRH